MTISSTKALFQADALLALLKGLGDEGFLWLRSLAVGHVEMEETAQEVPGQQVLFRGEKQVPLQSMVSLELSIQGVSKAAGWKCFPADMGMSNSGELEYVEY